MKKKKRPPWGKVGFPGSLAPLLGAAASSVPRVFSPVCFHFASCSVSAVLRLLFSSASAAASAAPTPPLSLYAVLVSVLLLLLLSLPWSRVPRVFSVFRSYLPCLWFFFFSSSSSLSFFSPNTSPPPTRSIRIPEKGALGNATKSLTDWRSRSDRVKKGIISAFETLALPKRSSIPSL